MPTGCSPDSSNSQHEVPLPYGTPLRNLQPFDKARSKFLFQNRPVADQHHRNEKLVIQLFQYVVRLREAQTIEVTRFPDRHFWQQGYDKAMLRMSALGLRALPSAPISCWNTPKLWDGLKGLEQVGDAPQTAREPRRHAA